MLDSKTSTHVWLKQIKLSKGLERFRKSLPKYPLGFETYRGEENKNRHAVLGGWRARLSSVLGPDAFVPFWHDLLSSQPYSILGSQLNAGHPRGMRTCCKAQPLLFLYLECFKVFYFLLFSFLPSPLCRRSRPKFKFVRALRSVIRGIWVGFRPGSMSIDTRSVWNLPPYLPGSVWLILQGACDNITFDTTL